MKGGKNEEWEHRREREWKKCLIVVTGRSETDLVGQLVEMFDDLVRREDEYATNHVVSPSCNIPVALQERLNGLVSQNQRESLFGAHMAECETPHNNHQANKLPDCIRDDDASSSSSTSSLIIINHHEQPDDTSPSPRRYPSHLY